MSAIFWKNLLKCLPTTIPSSHPLPTEGDCEALPLPLSDHRRLLHESPTINTKPSTMVKNFNTLYDLSSSSNSKSLSTPSTNSSFSSDSQSHSDSDIYIDSPPDFATIFASQRLFFSSPGHSNSIVESPDTPRSPPEPHQSTVSGGIAVKKYSADPYSDFKHSMQEMIDATELRDVRANWDYLHELLSCYLALNPEHAHKFIITAFVDIVISLLSSPPSPPLISTHR